MQNAVNGLSTPTLNVMGVPVYKLATTTAGTVADSGTATDAQHLGGVIYQDASGGNVGWTTRTAAQLIAAFGMPVGCAVPQFVVSNHATNTSTVTGGSGVTVVGGATVTRIGGTFMLLRTGTSTCDLVRVG